MAAPVADIYAQCSNAYGLGLTRCGGVTVDDIAKTTLLTLEDIYKDGNAWRIMGSLIEGDILAKSCQIRQNALYDWLMSVARPMGGTRLNIKRAQGLLEVDPFITGKRKGLINANYWYIVGSSASSGTSPGGVAYEKYYDLRSQTSIPADTRWFSPKMTLFVRGLDSGTNGATTTAWMVQDAAIIGGSTTDVRVYINSQNANAANVINRTAFPTAGSVTRGVPNVSNYDSWCNQIPDLNTNQIAHWWIQTTRYTVCTDELVEQYLTALREGNPMFRNFGDNDSVEVNRQILTDFQKAQVETFFWQKPLPNQTLELYPSLEAIEMASGASVSDYFNLPGLSGRVVGRRANAVGVYEQLGSCGRVRDLVGQNLNIPEFLGELYQIKRTREDNSIPANIIEVVTDSAYAVQLRQGFMRYLRNRFEGTLQMNMDVNAISKTLPTGFTFTDIQLDYPAGLTLRIVTHPAFDDLLGAHVVASSSLANVGRMMMILDLGNSIYPAIIATDSVTNETGDLSTLAAVNADMLCRMRVSKRRVKHTSVTFTAVVDCPGSSLIIENIGGGIPEHCGPVGSTTDLYGDIA